MADPDRGADAGTDRHLSSHEPAPNDRAAHDPAPDGDGTRDAFEHPDQRSVGTTTAQSLAATEHFADRVGQPAGATMDAPGHSQRDPHDEGARPFGDSDPDQQ